MRTRLILNNKLVGEIDESKGVYISFRNREHFFKKFDGFGLSSKVIDILYSKKVTHVIINYETSKVFFASLDSFIVNGNKYLDGEDEQYVLALKYFKTDNDLLKDNSVQIQLEVTE